VKHEETYQYEISLEFTRVKLPPVTDILILGKKYPHGKHGVLQAFKYIAPDEFELLEIKDNETVEALLVDKRIIKRLPEKKLISILEKYIFPYIASDEAIKVDLDLKVLCTNIKGVIHE